MIDGLSSILSVDKTKLSAQVNKNSQYEIVKLQVEKDLADKVRAYVIDKKISGVVSLEQSTKRYYPNGTLASTILGFVGSDNQGLLGLEQQYDTVLKGVPGRVTSYKNGVGGDMQFTDQTIVEAKPGDSLVLTIDDTLQYYLENVLSQAVKQNKVDKGCAIAMNVNTGAVLAMASLPDFNPNTPLALSKDAIKRINDATENAKLPSDSSNTSKGVISLASGTNNTSSQITTIEQAKALAKTNQTAIERQLQWQNYGISSTYDPGSVFKLLTGSAALEEGVVNTNWGYYDSGHIQIADRTYYCAEKEGHGQETLLQCYQNSCNPAFIQMGQLLGAAKFTKYREAYGIQNITGIDLPGEAASIYHPAKTLTKVELASESFGQSLTVTPIQMITSVCAVANGGYLVQPHVVSQIIDQNGNIIKNVATVQKRQVISTATSTEMRTLMASVVTKEGTGKNAVIPGYAIGGKTGTSEDLVQEKKTGQPYYIGSFAAVAPIDDPQIAVLLVLNHPTNGSYYGGTIAAPPVAGFLSQALPYIGVQPKYTTEELAAMNSQTPDVLGMSVKDAQANIKKAKLFTKIIGNGKSVVNQLPSSTQTIPKNGIVVLYTDNTSDDKITVPDFSKKTVSESLKEASSNNININLSGSQTQDSGAIGYTQSIAAGTKVSAGTVISVTFVVNVTEISKA